MEHQELQKGEQALILAGAAHMVARLALGTINGGLSMTAEKDSDWLSESILEEMVLANLQQRIIRHVHSPAK